MGFVHNYSMTCACILGNDCPKFGKLLQDWAADYQEHWVTTSTVHLLENITYITLFLTAQ